LALTATIFGIFALLPNFESNKAPPPLGVTVLTMFSILLWLIHYYQTKDWISMVEVSVVMALNLRNLYVLLSKPKTEERSVFRQTSDGVYGYTFEECGARE
jgi:hypothetical protein